MISELTEVCKQDDGDNGEICFPTQQKTKKTGNKLLIEEISGDKKKPTNKRNDFLGPNVIKRLQWLELKQRNNDKKNEEIKMKQEVKRSKNRQTEQRDLVN